MNPLLSICIPTFNRSKLLKELLDSIAEAAKGYLDKIEVVVSDNSSTDNTNEIVESFKIHGIKTIYWFHKKPLDSGEHNFYFVASKASCEYFWIIGDDDKIEPQAIKVILSVISEELDMAICNFSRKSKDLSQTYSKAYLPVGLPSKIKDRGELMRLLGPHLSFLSSVVIRRELFFNISLQEYLKYAPFGLSFLFSVYYVLTPKSKIDYISAPLVINRCENSNLTDQIWVKYFVEGISLVLSELEKHGYKHKDINRARTIQMLDYILPFLVTFKINGDDLSPLTAKVYRYCKSNVLTWAFFMPIAILPVGLVRMIKGSRVWVKSLLRYSQ